MDDTGRLREALLRLGVNVERTTDVLEVPGGLTLRPWRVQVDEYAGGVRVLLGVRVQHPQWFPTKTAELTAGYASTVEQAVEYAIQMWSAIDLPVVLQAVGLFAGCEVLERNLGGGRRRRVLLGPVERIAESTSVDPSGAHEPRCRCCLFTHTRAALEPLLVAPGPCMVRLEVHRGEHGAIDAICRAEGSAVEAAAPLLMAWASTWPGAGYEMRRQLIVFQDAE